MLRRLHPEQPDSFAFTEENRVWAEAQMTKFPEGRQASAIIPILWRAQEQEGWLSRAAIEHVAGMLDLAYIRALEVATFYFMFQLQPVGSVAHFQICGTTSCMICGAEDLIAICREKIAAKAHELSADGKFSWEEVECLGACANAPMAQIGKDYYEDLTPESLSDLIDRMAAGEVPRPGPQNGRFSSEPASGLTSLAEGGERRASNVSVTLATDLGDTLRRIDGTELPLRTPWRDEAPRHGRPTAQPPGDVTGDRSGARPADATGVTKAQAPAEEKARPETDTRPSNHAPVAEKAAHAEAAGTSHSPAEAREEAMTQGTPDAGADRTARHDPASGDAASPETSGGTGATAARKPETLDAPRDGAADDLKRIRGIGPKIEQMLNGLGFYHIAQIAGWGRPEIAWVDEHLEGFRGRIDRDDWVAQAKVLAEGGETEFSERVDDGEVHDGPGDKT